MMGEAERMINKKWKEDVALQVGRTGQVSSHGCSDQGGREREGGMKGEGGDRRGEEGKGGEEKIGQDTVITGQKETKQNKDMQREITARRRQEMENKGINQKTAVNEDWI